MQRTAGDQPVPRRHGSRDLVADHLQPELDIARSREPGKQAMLLKHHRALGRRLGDRRQRASLLLLAHQEHPDSSGGGPGVARLDPLDQAVERGGRVADRHHGAVELLRQKVDRRGGAGGAELLGAPRGGL